MSGQPRPTPSEPLRFFQYRYNEKRDAYYFETPIGRSRWYAKQGACKTDAFLAEQECKRRGWILNRESDAREERISELEGAVESMKAERDSWINAFNDSEAENAKLREALNPPYRYFLDKDGFRWKVPTNGGLGFGLPTAEGSEWVSCGITLDNVLLCHEFIRGESVETDENGVPLRKEEE